MQGEVLRKVNYVEEAYHLLCQLAEDRKAGVAKEKLRNRYGVTDEEALSVYDLLEKILAEGQKRFQEKKEILRFYFAPRTKSKGVPAQFVLLGSVDFGECDTETVEQFRESLYKMSEQDYLDSVYLSCYAYGAAFCDEVDESHKSMTDIFSYILEMDIPDDEKLLLQDCILHREKHREAALSLLSEATDFLGEYSEELKKWSEKTADYWEEILKERDFREYMSLRSGITLDDNPKGYVILPRFFEPGGFSLTCALHKEDNGEMNPSAYICRIGYMMDHYVPIKTMLQGSDKETEDQALQVFKILSDKSKFEILKYIRNRRAYGGELAKQLNLTTATISHHMSVLIEAGLVELEKEDNKIYYRTDKKTLGNILQYCKNLFEEGV